MSLSPVLDAGPLLGVTSRRAIKRRLQVLGVPLVAFGPRLYVDLGQVQDAVAAVTRRQGVVASPALPGKMPPRHGRAF